MAASAHTPLPGAPEPWAPSEMPRFRARPPYLMSEMIAAEPELADRLLRRLARDEATSALADAVRAAADAREPVTLIGCGTSEHAAMGVAALLNEALDPPSGAEVRSVQALETIARPQARGVVVAISHEGGTTVTNEAIRAARGAGARTALVTVGAGSPGAALAEIVVTTEEQDQSWCHTVGYLSPLLVGLALSARLRSTRVDGAAARSLLDVATDTRAASAMAAALAGSDRLIVAGSGADHGSARELALKVAEGARLPAAAHELETLLHGHLAAANRWSGLVLVLTDVDRVPPLVVERALRVLSAARALALPSGAIVADAISDRIGSELTPAGRIVTPHTGRVRGTGGALLVAAMALQVLAERLARARGVNPDTLAREDPAQASAHA